MKCIICNKEKVSTAFGKRPDLLGGRDPRCKVCINEASKATIRRGQLLRLADDIGDWSPEKLVSELEYLDSKMQIVTKELQRRQRYQ